MREHPGTFVAGVVFLLVGLVYLLDGLGAWTVDPGRIWPLFIIAAGVVVLAGALVDRDED